jgi:hypothetical protein
MLFWSNACQRIDSQGGLGTFSHHEIDDPKTVVVPSTIAEVGKLFVAGAESVTLTRAEWEGIREVSKGYHANCTEVSKAKREMERVKRISRPVWRACKVVAAQMRSAMEGRHMAKPPVIALVRVRDWEMRLRHSMDVSWSDLPMDHPKRMVDWRR